MIFKMGNLRFIDSYQFMSSPLDKLVNNLYQEETTRHYEDGARLFQICQHNFLPWTKIVLTDELPSPPDNRGSGGFGSTGLQLENHPRT